MSNANGTIYNQAAATETRTGSGGPLLPRLLALLVAALLVAGVAGHEAVAQDAADEKKPTKAKDARTGGELIWHVTSPEGWVIYAVAVDDDGLYVVGNNQRGAKAGGRIEKRNPEDGKLIWTKDVDVTELLHLDIDGEHMYLAAQPWLVQKRKLSDGSLVWEKRDEIDGKPYALAIDDKAMYVTGRGGSGWRVQARSLADGKVLWDESTVNGVALATAVDGNGLYVGGYDTTPGDQQWRMEKRDPATGKLAWQQTLNPSKSSDKVYGVAVDDTGVYAAGVECAKDAGQYRVEKRSLSDGKIIWEHTLNPSDTVDKAHGLAADETGVYIPGYQDSKTWRISKRNLDDGKLIWEALSSKGGRLWYAVDTDDEAVYVGGYVDGKWRIEKRAK